MLNRGNWNTPQEQKETNDKWAPTLLGGGSSLQNRELLFRAVGNDSTAVSNGVSLLSDPNMRGVAFHAPQPFSNLGGPPQIMSQKLNKSSNSSFLEDFGQNKEFTIPFFPEPTLTTVNKDESSIPLWDEPINYRNSFTSKSTPDNCVSKIFDILQQSEIVDFQLNKSEYLFEGRVFSDLDMAEFAISIFKLPCDDNYESVVEFQRRCGDGFSYQTFFSTIMEKLMDASLVGKSAYSQTSIGNQPTFGRFMQPSTDFFLQPLNVSQGTEILVDLVNSVETGYHNVCRRAACTLAVQSKHTSVRTALATLPNIICKFTNTIQSSVDVLMVRSLVIVLANLFQDDKMKQQARELKIDVFLKEIREKWDKEQSILGGCVKVMKSKEISNQVNMCLAKLSR